MEYTREEIIKIGEKEIANSRKLWRSFAIIALVAFLIGLAVLITLLILKELIDEISITAFVIFEIHTLGFTIFAFIYSYQKQYDRFEVGRRVIENRNKTKLVEKKDYTTLREPIKPIEEDNNHNFDDFFTDEEFDDLMDD